VMRVTRGLAREGMTVVATIHCPPPHTFALFDRLLVLQRGRAAYFGANGPRAAAYFLGLPAKARHRPTPGRPSPRRSRPRTTSKRVHGLRTEPCYGSFATPAAMASMIRSRRRPAAAVPRRPIVLHACCKQRPTPWDGNRAPLGNVQVRAKGADENLADWIVHITTDADRQGDDGFVQAYARCATHETHLTGTTTKHHWLHLMVAARGARASPWHGALPVQPQPPEAPATLEPAVWSAWR